jgi:hypothetical protein
MKFIRSLAIATAAAATLSSSFPTTPALADGRASTRNLLLLGGAAATYLIVEHNRKVHEREAQAAERQAAAEQSSNNAWAAYHQAEHAYQAEAAENAELKREVTYQHTIVKQQRQELASLGAHENGTYGWGTI